VEALIHAGAVNDCRVDIEWIHAETVVSNNLEQKLKDVSGILVAPGFGERGIEGKLEVVKYARTNGIPFFGICLGLQCAVIEYARNVCGWSGANSIEFEQEPEYAVIDLMEEQKHIKDKGGT